MLEGIIIKMSISEKIKAMDNKIEQNKAQYNLEIQTAEISKRCWQEFEIWN